MADLADLERQRDSAARGEGRGREKGLVGRRTIQTKLRSGKVVESDLQVSADTFQPDFIVG